MLGFITIFIASCSSNEVKKIDLIKKYEKMLANNDLQTAVFYLQEYLFLDSTNISYSDSLARHYEDLNNALAAEKYARKVVITQPLNEHMQEIIAVVAMQKGQETEAINIYEKLFETTKDFTHLYNLGIIYSELGKSENALQIADRLMQEPDSEIKTIRAPMLSAKTKQSVSLEAAALLLKSVVQLRPPANNRAKSYEYLKECLTLQPDFEVAQNLANQYFGNGGN